MSVSAFDHPWLGALLGDERVSAAFSAEADLRAMLRFEAALAQAQAEVGVIPQAAAEAVAVAADGLEPEVEALAEGARRDGVVAPELVRLLRAAVGEPHGRWVHYGATSQDVVDTSLMLRLAPLVEGLGGRLAALGRELEGVEARFGDRALMARTRMRRALPIRVRDRVAGWRAGVAGSAEAAGRLRAETLAVQLAGPVGTLEALGERGPEVRARLAAALGLVDPGGSWHVDRRRIGAVGAWAAEATTALGRIGADLALMAQDEIGAAAFSGGGGSSAMAHKVNPVDAEALVALARANATALGGLGQALLHEQERSGAMWTLEWITLPPMLAAAGGALNAAGRLIGRVTRLGDPEA